MSIFRCKDAVRDLQMLLDREASFKIRISVRLHLLMCTPCRRYFRQQRLLQALLKTAAHASPFPDLSQALRRLPSPHQPPSSRPEKTGL